jgi:hypothetical protein
MKKSLFALLAGMFVFSSVAYGAAEFKPFDGFQGYQDIKVSENLYYVAYHGNRDAKYEEVVAAWGRRAAQLCAQATATHYVELSHLLEPLTKKETDAFIALEPTPRMIYAAGPVYIPIYMPSGPRAARVDAPSKMAGVRCVRETGDILLQDRLISVEKSK